jgi:hypothetical protein
MDVSADDKRSVLKAESKASPAAAASDGENDMFSQVSMSSAGVIEPTPLDQDSITLSSLPKSRWQTLPVLDLIRERNKPKEAPKAPVAPSFFIATTGGLDPKLNPSADPLLAAAYNDNGQLSDEDKKAAAIREAAKSKMISSSGALASSSLAQLLEKATASLEPSSCTLPFYLFVAL